MTKPIRKAVDKVTEAEEITETDNEAEKYSFISMLPKVFTITQQVGPRDDIFLPTCPKIKNEAHFKFIWFVLQCFNLSSWVLESSITPNSKVIPIPVIPEKALRIRDEDSQIYFLSE